MSADTPTVSRNYGIVAVFADVSALARALDDILAAGVPAAALTVLARDGSSGQDTPDKLAESLDPPAVDELLGGVLGAYFGLLGGLLLLIVPGLGPVVLAGGATAIVAETLASAVAGAGLGTVLGAIFDEDHVERHREFYHRALEADQVLLSMHGSESEYEAMMRCLERHAPLHVDQVLPSDDEEGGA